jgi:hypothetical protein
VELLTAGLCNPVRTDVDLQYPSNLEAAMSLAFAYERRGHEDEEDFPTQVPKPSGSKLLKSTVTTVPAVAKGTSTTGNQVPGGSHGIAGGVPNPARKPFKRLTPAEMEDRRVKGLCYNCDEKFQRGHRCKNLFSLVVAMTESDGEEEDPNQDEPSISLHALTGVNTGTTLQLIVYVLGVQLMALLDSGSTHNFISTEAATQCGANISQRKGIRAALTNGDQVESSGICRGLGITIFSEPFDVDCYAIPLGGFDVVLGVQWLSTLGPSLWDFNNLTLLFWRGNEFITWQGKSKPAMATHAIQCTERGLLDELLLRFKGLFATPEGLPPSRPCDHRIHLLPGFTPVVVRPYRYPAI